MAYVFGDVDKSPPETPRRASSSPSSLSTTPTRRSRTTRFINATPVQSLVYTQAPEFKHNACPKLDPGAQGTGSENPPGEKVQDNSLTRATDDVFEEMRIETQKTVEY
ncbi:hypothetical protein GcM3_145020 [Golovinomyces cichoracearum]|uniref:Uncharacterized protein n=1 Tax=Golovinomyces cichoracearum TaxID=62708 RepID=A0A420HZ27_9PEZI|nr:hypothetical protein GcM3_145020 [Golovinomyces cichoracearum]